MPPPILDKTITLLLSSLLYIFDSLMYRSLSSCLLPIYLGYSFSA